MLLYTSNLNLGVPNNLAISCHDRMNEKVSAKLFCHTKILLKNGIRMSTNHMMMVIHLKSAKSKAISI
jgi:hypothetical protein